MLLNQGARYAYGPSYFRGRGSTILDAMGYQLGCWDNDGSQRNFYGGEHTVSGQTNKAGIPSGNRHPVAWTLAPKAGGISSRRATNIDFSQAGNAVLGLPGSGSAEITLTTTATGGLIVSGSGSATITLSPTGTLISVAAGSGSATITLTGDALIGALAGISGQGAITLSPTAAIRAVGFMSGLSTNETEFSAAALANAVWQAAAADYTLAGSMGEKLNAAGTAGDPWTADVSGYAPDTAGDKLNKTLSVGKFMALK